MAEEHKDHLPHILVKDTATASGYTRPPRVITSTRNIPARNRNAHAEFLLGKLQQAQEAESAIVEEQKAFGLDAGNGIYISFESDPEFDLKFESLEFQRSGIELCTIKETDNKWIATIFVPEGKLTHFLKKIGQYRDEETKPKKEDQEGKPRHKDLVESIADIKLAAIDALWTDGPELLPTDNTAPFWWEVWLRHSHKIDYEAFLREHSAQLEMAVSSESIRFLDRTVILVSGTKQQMSRSIHLLGSIAELRAAKESAAFFTGLDRIEQQDWINNALQRTTPPPEQSPRVCLLDTGINEQHPLLQPVTTPNDIHTYNPAWGTDDREGHGTPMAGLAAYGDLTQVLAGNDPIELTHKLESVKIIPFTGNANDKELYGAVTRESVSRAEINQNGHRVFCMAVTTTDDRDRGKPSSWSATVDALTSGYEDEEYRLMILSAGNTDPAERHHYPDSSLTDEVHDPGQAWNALTVGAYTEKAWLDTAQYPGWQPIAPQGDLSPASCTSMEWQRTWPIKPDIVMEGGNMGLHPNGQSADYIDDALQLLSTGHQFAMGRQLVSFGDTSASSAQAARLAAMVQKEYPDYLPETIRALLVHSADWTDAMKARFNPLNTKEKYRQLLRYCGYGAPNVDDLFWSAQNALTLIAQDGLQPYSKQGSQQPKTRDINIHELPWPTDVLRDLGETQVEMKVTLSYFIEPNPGERGWSNKYRYASHGLRFDVRRSLENLDEFKQRINQQARDEEYNRTSVKETGEWMLGERLRSLGSIHSDTWRGNAAELAERSYIAIYPVLGWWKERPNLQRWGKRARYSLIITIRTPEVETDIYTPVVNLVTAVVEV